LLSVLNEFSLPTKVVHIIEDTTQLPHDHPANAKNRLEDKATVYVCTGPVCSAPANTPQVLRAILEEKNATT
ncbi:MAG: thioredoxin domain-containing protein, partial [Sneathiella sp.]